MIGISDPPISAAQVSVGVRLQSCIRSEPQNHAAMLDGLRKILMLLLVRADVEMTKGIVCIDFNCRAKVRNGLFVFPFIHQRPTQTVFRDEISACNL